MTRVPGARHDLSERVKTHLFVLCPNNSGSTFLVRCLALCHACWSLHREGQAILGFAGPRTQDRGHLALRWASTPESRALFGSPANYDWEKSKRAWYFAATAEHEHASVFVTKSPPHLLVADQLVAHFPGTRFILMVRDPYATVEGILRARSRPGERREERVFRAAEHVRQCFLMQLENRERHAARSIFFTYEEMCARPGEIAERIRRLVPALHDLDLDRTVPVKGRYDERLRDMNADQIARLAARDVAVISDVFRKSESVFTRFGYSLLAPA